MAHRKGLDIDQNLAFQRREWAAQRAGWWALTAFVAAAALGAFGKGPISGARAADAAGRLSVEYDRFARVGAPTRLEVRAEAAAAGAGPIEIRLTRDYFDAVQIERVLPEPAAVEVGPAEVTFRFGAPAPGTGFAVVLDLQPRRAGWRTAAIRTAQGGAVSFSQLTYF